MIETTEKTKIYNIYCDESHQDSDKNEFPYIVLGALYFDRKKRMYLGKKIKNIKKEYSINGELKWSKISASRLNGYKRIMDLFFDESFYFQCVSIKKIDVDYKSFHNNNKDIAFFKFLYNLLKQVFYISEPFGANYYIFLDYKPTNRKRYLDLYQFISRKAIDSKNKVLKLQAYDSYENVFLQLCDILCGVVSYKKNNVNLVNTSKDELANYIMSKLDKTDFDKTTPIPDRKFNIFNLIPGYKKNVI